MEDQEKLLSSDSYPKHLFNFLSFLRAKRAFMILIIPLILVWLGAGVYYLSLKKLLFFKDPVLATVEGEEIKKSFFDKKLKHNCLTGKGERKESLNALIDFLILKQGAKKLGIKISEKELKSLFDQKSFPRIKNCPEEFLKDVLRSKIREKISPLRVVEALILTSSLSEAKVRKVILLVSSGQFSSLWAAANSVFAQERAESEGGLPPFYARQLTVTPDSLGKGVFKDQSLFKLAFSLKKGQISEPLKVVKGPLKDQLVVLRAIDLSAEGEFAGFDDWFSKVKKGTEIKIYD